MTSYSQVTLAQLRLRLGQLLGDDSGVFWTSAELDTYIREALRWWGLSTMYFRQTAKFDTVAGQAFYTLPSVITDLAGTALQSFTVTDREVINDLNYALMEPQITTWASGWQGSEMFTLEELTSALQASRDEILKISGLLTTERSVSVVVPHQSRIDLVDETIRIVRVSFEEVSSDGPLVLWATDNIQDQTTIIQTWRPEPKFPKAFSVNYVPQLSIDLWPSPQNDGALRTYSVESGASFDPTTTATAIGLPDDSCWLTKYRALEDLLSGDGLNRAWKLSQYSHQRVVDGLDALALYESILWADINGRRVPITSLAQLDQVRPRWQQVDGTPRQIAQLSWNQIVLYPVPDGIYRIILETPYKAPIPIADGDFIQVGQESLQAILDYAQHVASFKMQGGEFDATISLYQSAAEQARDYRAQIAGQSIVGYKQNAWQTRMDRWSRPYRARQVAEEANLEVVG